MPDRQSPLLDLVSRLGESHSLSDVVDTVVHIAGPAVGAAHTMLSVANEVGTQLDTYTASTPSTPAAVAVGSSSPLAVAARTGEPVVTRFDAAETSLKNFELPGDWTWLVSMAIEAGGGRNGSVTFLFAEADEPRLHDIERLQLAARWIGGAVESVLYRERATALVESLQTEVLQQGHVPVGVEFAGRYRPPWPGEPMGGDWFDAFTASGGTGVVVVGDVAGHGIGSAPTMIALRAYVRALAYRDPHPHEILRSIDHMLTEFSPGSGLLTIALATLDPSADELLLVNAGLPPLIHKTAEGETSFVESGRARLLGSGLEPQVHPPARIPFRTGDTVLIATDGALKPGAEGAAGMDDIFAVVNEDDSGDLDKLVCEALETTRRHDGRVDDATVVAIRANKSV